MLRQRAVDLEMNNPLVKSALGAFVCNVVECGIRPKLNIADIERRRRIMAWWDHWCESEADLTGDQHYYEMQALWLRSVLRDGGSLLRMRTLNARQSRGRMVPIACELIPEERIATDADTYSRPTNEGNPIVSGIEFDAETGRNLAYWIRRENGLAPWETDQTAVRIDANECVYGYAKTRAGMKRGITVFSATIAWLWKLGYFTDNELMASAMKSCFGPVIETNDNTGTITDDWDPGTLQDAHGNLLAKLTPGIVARLRPGEKITGVGPNTPGGDSIPWIQLIQRCIAVGVDLSYFGLTRDTSESNFAAYRAGGNEDRKRYRMLQKFTVNKFCRPSWVGFMRWGVIRGLDGFPTSSEFTADPNIWNRVTWQAPGWDPVTPIDDARANEIEVKMGTKTRQEIIAARGGDWEETFEQLRREDEKAEDESINVAPWVTVADTTQVDGDGESDNEQKREARYAA